MKPFFLLSLLLLLFLSVANATSPNACSGVSAPHCSTGHKCLVNGTGTAVGVDAICVPSCGTTPCQNGGTCSGGTCGCTPNFGGNFCEIRNRCPNDYVCLNGGTCNSVQYIGGAYEYACTGCEPGFYGASCTLTNPTQIVFSDWIARSAISYNEGFDPRNDLCSQDQTSSCDGGLMTVFHPVSQFGVTFMVYPHGDPRQYVLDFSNNVGTFGSLDFNACEFYGDFDVFFRDLYKTGSTLANFNCNYRCVFNGDIYFNNNFTTLTNVVLMGNFSSFGLTPVASYGVNHLAVALSSDGRATLDVRAVGMITNGSPLVIVCFNLTTGAAWPTVIVGVPGFNQTCSYDIVGGIPLFPNYPGEDSFFGNGSQPLAQQSMIQLANINFASSQIPDNFFGGMTNATNIYLVNVGLHGTIPESISSLAFESGVTLSFANNFLDGTIPASIESFGHNLAQFDVFNNNLSGSIPAFLLNTTLATGLTCLSVEDNPLFDCPIESDLLDCTTGRNLADVCTSNCPSGKNFPCVNGGLCTLGGFCDCSETEYGGSNCTIFNTCFSDPCLHNGTCSFNFTSNAFSCGCDTYYAGTTCQITSDCLNSFGDGGPWCINNGTCHFNQTSAVTTCSCAAGFAGNNCEQTDLCASNDTNPCFGGHGRCVQSTSDPYAAVCLCDYPYGGLSCNRTVAINNCTDIFNAGFGQGVTVTCDHTVHNLCMVTGNSSYVCVPAAPTNTYTCQNGGTVIDASTSEFNLPCACAGNYFGFFCEQLFIGSYAVENSVTNYGTYTIPWWNCPQGEAVLNYTGHRQGAHVFECANCPSGLYGPDCLQITPDVVPWAYMISMLIDIKNSPVSVPVNLCSLPDFFCQTQTSGPKKLGLLDLYQSFIFADLVALNITTDWSLPFIQYPNTKLVAFEITQYGFLSDLPNNTATYGGVSVGFDYDMLFKELTPATAPKLEGIIIADFHPQHLINATVFGSQLTAFSVALSDHATNSPHIEIHNATKVVSVIGTKDFSVDIDYFQQARNSSIVNPGGNTYDPNTPGVLFTVACVNFGPSLFSPSVGEANVIITDINPDCVISSTQPLVNSVLQRIHYNLQTFIVSNVIDSRNDLSYLDNVNCTAYFPTTPLIQFTYSGLTVPFGSLLGCIAETVAATNFTANFPVVLFGNQITTGFSACVPVFGSQQEECIIPGGLLHPVEDFDSIMSIVPDNVLAQLVPFFMNDNQLQGSVPTHFFAKWNLKTGDSFYDGSKMNLLDNPFTCDFANWTGISGPSVGLRNPINYLTICHDLCYVGGGLIFPGNNRCNSVMGTTAFNFTCQLNDRCECLPDEAGCVGGFICPAGYYGARCLFDPAYNLTVNETDATIFMLNSAVPVSLPQGGTVLGYNRGYAFVSVDIAAPFLFADPAAAIPVMCGDSDCNSVQNFAIPVDNALFQSLCGSFGEGGSFSVQLSPQLNSTNALDELPNGRSAIPIEWTVGLTPMCTFSVPTNLPDLDCTLSTHTMQISCSVGVTTYGQCNNTLMALVVLSPDGSQIVYTQTPMSGAFGGYFTLDKAAIDAAGYDGATQLPVEILSSFRCLTSGPPVRKRSAGPIITTFYNIKSQNITIPGGGTPTPTSTSTPTPTSAGENTIGGIPVTVAGPVIGVLGLLVLVMGIGFIYISAKYGVPR